jgi:hypothetical protein
LLLFLFKREEKLREGKKREEKVREVKKKGRKEKLS